jgi:adenylate kinase
MAHPTEPFAALAPLTSDAPQALFKSVLLVGAPGSGKGMQGTILKNIPGFFHFSSGEVFRRLDMSSPLGKVFLQYSSRGELVPDDVVIRLWAATLQAHTVLGDFKPARHLLVLDGIPRTVQQARMVEQYLEILKVIHLECGSQDVMIDRLRNRALMEGRPDDTDEKVIRKRFTVYEAETRPLLDYYPPEKIVAIDSTPSPARVAGAILAVLAPLQDQVRGGV